MQEIKRLHTRRLRRLNRKRLKMRPEAEDTLFHSYKVMTQGYDFDGYFPECKGYIGLSWLKMSFEERYEEGYIGREWRK
jgi:hypothetical protein